MLGILFIAFALGMPCRAATVASVRTLDGNSYDGDLHFDDDGQTLLMTPRKGPPVKLDLASILSADFKGRPPVLTTRPVTQILPDGPLPKPWIGQDLGMPNGNHVWSKKTGFTIDVGPTPIPDNGKTPENTHVIYQQISGDATLIAHVASPDDNHNHGHVAFGLMMRSDLSNIGNGSGNGNNPAKAGSFAELLVHSQHGPMVFMTHAVNGGNHGNQIGRAQGGDVWLKLTRSGENVLAYTSTDGEQWENVDSADLQLGVQLYVGLIVRSKAAVSVTFDNVSLSSAAGERLEGASAGKSVLLRSGGALGGIGVLGGDDTAIKITRKDGQEATLPVSGIARLDFRPIKPEMLAKVPPHAAGLLLARGDFVEGDFKGIDKGRIKISSVIFGIASFDIDVEAASLILHDVEAPRSSYVVRTWDGSVYTVKSIKFDSQSLTLEDELAGTVKISIRDLQEIRAGGARFSDLFDLYPEDGRSLPAIFNGMPMRVNGSETDRAIVCAAGSSLTYNLDGKYRLLIAKVAVPDYLLPMAGVSFLVSADGKEIFRSAPLTGIDEPQSVSLNLSGVNKLTLTVERADAGSWPMAGMWTEAALVK